MASLCHGIVIFTPMPNPLETSGGGEERISSVEERGAFLRKKERLWARLNIFGFADDVYSLEGALSLARWSEVQGFHEYLSELVATVTHMVLRVRAISMESEQYDSLPGSFPVNIIHRLMDCLGPLENILCDIQRLRPMTDTNERQQAFMVLSQLVKPLHEQLLVIVEDFRNNDQYSIYKKEDAVVKYEGPRKELQKRKRMDDAQFCNEAWLWYIQQEVRNDMNNLVLNNGMVVNVSAHNSSGKWSA